MTHPKRIVLFITLAFLLYLGSYSVLRSNSIETWEKDGQDYVIFPSNPRVIYYFYRPLSLIDAKLTGMRFHIGPHQH